VKRALNAAEYPAHVANCIVVLLASKLAAALANDPNLSLKFLEEYNADALPKARIAEAVQTHVFPGNDYWHTEAIRGV
jgi:hypothetical protein